MEVRASDNYAPCPAAATLESRVTALEQLLITERTERQKEAKAAKKATKEALDREIAQRKEDTKAANEKAEAANEEAKAANKKAEAATEEAEATKEALDRERAERRHGMAALALPMLGYDLIHETVETMINAMTTYTNLDFSSLPQHGLSSRKRAQYATAWEAIRTFVAPDGLSLGRWLVLVSTNDMSSQRRDHLTAQCAAASKGKSIPITNLDVLAVVKHLATCLCWDHAGTSHLSSLLFVYGKWLGDDAWQAQLQHGPLNRLGEIDLRKYEEHLALLQERDFRHCGGGRCKDILEALCKHLSTRFKASTSSKAAAAASSSPAGAARSTKAVKKHKKRKERGTKRGLSASVDEQHWAKPKHSRRR